MGYIAAKEYLVHYYEIDYKKRCLITSLLNYFQDLAFLQSDLQGAGIDFLAERNLAWVLYRLDVKVSKYPQYHEKIKISTYAYSFVKFYAYRKFAVLDDSGETVATADTAWFLVDTAKKKPVKINDHMYAAFGVDANTSNPVEFDDLAEGTKVDSESEYKVRYSDIDTNRHVNNVKYVDWAIETVPLNTIAGYHLARVKAIYKAEAAYGKSIKAYTQSFPKANGLIYLHRIVDHNGKELSRLETTWVKG